MLPRPLVIAHRGSSELQPEHTALAYEQAIADGADGLECDVRLTADGSIVCIHDRRIERTSRGHGIVSNKTYAELSEFDYGPLGNALPAAERRSTAGLLRLDDLIDIVLAAPRSVALSIETKHPVRFGTLVEDRVLAVLRRRGLLVAGSRVPVRMMSFSQGALRRIRNLAPSLPTVFLMDRIPNRCGSGWLPSGARIAGPEIAIVRSNPEFIAKLHSAGSAAHVWTVDDPEDVRLCARLGVDAVITNRPREVIQQLESLTSDDLS